MIVTDHIYGLKTLNPRLVCIVSVATVCLVLTVRSSLALHFEMNPLSHLVDVLFVGIFAITCHAKITYSTYAADSVISRSQGNGLDKGVPLVNYPDGEFQWALRLLYERDGNQTYYDWIQEGVNNIVLDNGTIVGGYKYVVSVEVQLSKWFRG